MGSHTSSREGLQGAMPHSPADVLNAPFTLLPELHVSLDGFLQVQDCCVLYYHHSCNTGQ